MLASRGTQLQRLAAGSMMLQERRMASALAKDVADANAQAQAETSRRRTRAALLVMLLGIGATLAATAKRTIAAGRQAVRAVAAARLGRELVAAGMTGVAIAELGSGTSRASDDDALAQAAALSLAGAWQGLAIASTAKAIRVETDVRRAIAETPVRIRPRIARIAATENAEAYSDEHLQALVDAMDFDRTYRDGKFADAIEEELVRQWSALLDDRTCIECADQDGEVAEADGMYDSGLEPGFVHANCRCQDIIIPRADAIKEVS